MDLPYTFTELDIDMQRKKFLQSLGIFAAGIFTARFNAIAGLFAPGELGHQIPGDKKLTPNGSGLYTSVALLQNTFNQETSCNILGCP